MYLFLFLSKNGYICPKLNSLINMSVEINKHLDCVLKSHNINLDSGELLNNYKKKRDKVNEALEIKFGNKIEKIVNSGSYAKKTAINIKFDMDLCIHFKKDSFNTLKEMYEAVFNYLNDEYKKEDDDLIKVRQQRVSTGLIFNVDGEDILFDVTGGRKFNNDEKDNDINLYQNVEDSNSKKTNIQKQIDKIIGRDKERESIKLLKVWKFHHFDIKSFLVELLTLEAFDKNSIDDEKGLWARLKKVIEFMRDNIETINLIDPGNSNNNVADSLDSEEKTKLKNNLTNMLLKIEKDESKIKHYFPLNEKYPCKKEENKYEQNSKNAPAILSTQSFG